MRKRDNNVLSLLEDKTNIYARKTALIWNGNKVYKLKIQSEEGVKSCRGYPQYLLVNGNKIKKATPEEALQIMRKYYGIKED